MHPSDGALFMMSTSDLKKTCVSNANVMCSTEIRRIWARIKIELVIDNESRDLQLYNDSFLILIGQKRDYIILKFVFTKLKTEFFALYSCFIWYNLSN